MARTKPTILISRQLPEHIREDYPTFVAFVEAYYEFLQQQSLDLSKVRDIDETLDRFIENFKKELGERLPTLPVDERFVLRHTKDQYLAKGSEASYKLLFRLLYGKEVDLFYPGQQMLRVSDGRWNQEVSVFAKVNFGDPSNIIGKLVDIRSGDVSFSVLVDRKQNLVGEVDRISLVDPNSEIYEFFLDKRFFGTVNPGDIIRLGDTFEAVIIPITSRIQITQPGRNFRVGQVFEIGSASGTTALMKVTAVTEGGGIKYAELIRFGVGYVANFANTILSVNTINSRGDNVTTSSTLVQDLTYESEAVGTLSADPTQLTVIGIGTSFGIVGNVRVGDELWTTEDPPKIIGVVKSVQNATSLTLAALPTDYEDGTYITQPYVGSFVFRNNDRVGIPYEPFSEPTFTYNSVLRSATLGFDEQGYINYCDYVDSEFVDGTYAGSVDKEFTLNFRNAQVNADDPAIINVSLGALAKYPGFFETNAGFLDDSIVIQDSRYYQAFSYVVRIDERLNSYKSAVKSMIHPAGMALFGEFNITNTYDLSLAVEALAVSLGVKLRDDVIIETDFSYIFVEKVLSSSTASIESDLITVSYIKSLETELFAEESCTKHVSKQIYTDSNIEDVVSLDFSKNLESEQSLSDATSLEISNVLSSEVLLEDDVIVSVVFEEEFVSTIDDIQDELSLNVSKEFSSEITTTDEASVSLFYLLESTVEIEDSLSYSIETALSLDVSIDETNSLEITKYEEETLQEQSHQGYVQLNPYYEEDYITFEDEYSVGSRTSTFS